jgi:hypothetical protein
MQHIDKLILAAILFYVVVCIVLYFQSGRIVRYEVREGSLTSTNIYDAIILRDEIVFTSPSSGHINYYASEGSRVAKNDLVYLIDETGKLSEQMETSLAENNTLSKRQLDTLKSDLSGFAQRFSPDDFDRVYDFKNTLSNAIKKLANANMLQAVQDMNASFSKDLKYIYSAKSGIVTYWIDGYEQLKPQDLNADLFDQKKYQKNQILSNSLIAKGDPAYKVTSDEHWSIVIPVEENRGKKLADEGFIEVRFLKNHNKSWGETKLHYDKEGNCYLQLTFTNSMVAFADQRFLEVELLIEDETGLKIPVSSVVQKEFFLIPERFIYGSSSSGKKYILKQTYLENGSTSMERIDVDVYSYDSDTKEYYLDGTFLSPGNLLLKEDGQETFAVSKKATLVGVYHMNKGYADFKQIHILYQNDEYAIVKSDTKYGLTVYDYIVLDASSVSDDQFLNEK